MSQKDIEIEIKVRVQKIKPLISFLKKEGKLLGTEHQIDKYFTPQHRDFLSVRPAIEWLRLRESKGKYSINYKNWHVNKKGNANYCDEFESQIESLTTLEKIFKALNIKNITVVDKKRETWIYKDYEIAIDSVKSLGTFVEIEYKGSMLTDATKITENMIDFLKEKQCGKIYRNSQGYPFLLLFPKEAQYTLQ